MDGQQVKLWESRCIEESPPACAAACPVHVDVRGIADALRKDDFKAALTLFLRSIPFPRVIAHCCDRPCEHACRRGEAGDAIRIGNLERACLSVGLDVPALRPLRAQARKRVAVVGAGLSAMTVAADLTVKGHSVVVFEAEARLLSRLRDMATATSSSVSLSEAGIEADLERFSGTPCEFRVGQQVSPDQLNVLLNEFDAVYLGIGPKAVPELADVVNLVDGRIAIDPLTYATSHPKLFAGGGQRYGESYSAILSLQDGRYAALSIERFLQGASLTASRENQGSQPSRLYVNVGRHAPLPAIVPADPVAGFRRDEAVAEASRCFPCHCLECVRVCPYLEHYGAYPKRYIREIYNNETIVMGARKSNRMIDSCTECGLCAEVCPESLSMGEVCQAARQGMTARGKMPPSHHDFALRDLAFNRSDAFVLARHQPGFTSSAVVFYPGCQLAASSPEQVERVYAHLCETIEGGVGLMLGCCGAPALWAARDDLFGQTRDEFREAWKALGWPVVLTACASCHRMFSEHVPEVPVESLWASLAASLPVKGLSAGAASHAPLAIHDPCGARYETGIQGDVRRLLNCRGVPTVELDGPEFTTCCGFGGLAQFANREVADKIVDRRIGQHDGDYLTYCAMCRDNFARRGKRAVHLLDLLFPGPEDPAARPDPGFSRRQENRAALKRRLLREVWKEGVMEPAVEIDLIVPEAVRADMERKLILLDDVRETIRHAESGGTKLIDAKTGYFIASLRRVNITYWVVYEASGEGAGASFLVHRAYSHRMTVEVAP